MSKFKRFLAVVFILSVFVGTLTFSPTTIAMPAGVASDLGRDDYTPALSDGALGYEGWGEAITVTQAEIEGININYKDAVTHIRYGLNKTAYKMDGMHIRFDNLSYTKGKLGLVLANGAIAEGTGNSGSSIILLQLDFERGALHCYPGDRDIIVNDALKATNLTDKNFSLKLTKTNEGYVASILGQTGIIANDIINASAINTESVYITFSAWDSTTLSFDLTSVHDSSVICKEDFTNIDHRFHAPSTSLGLTTDYWGDRFTVTNIQGGGINVSFTGGTYGVRTGLVNQFKLDGFHFNIENLNMTGYSEFPFLFGNISGNDTSFNPVEGQICFTLNTSTGAVTLYAKSMEGGNEVIGPNNALKNPAALDVYFEYNSDGSAAIVMNGQRGTISKEVMDASKLNEDIYITFESRSSAVFSFDLVSIHGGDEDCYKETPTFLLAEAEAVDDLIDAIGTVTLNSEDAIVAAKAAYDALTDFQKQFTTKYPVLTDAIQTLADLKEAQSGPTPEDTVAAQAVVDSISNLGTITLGSKDKIIEAKQAYDALTTLQKTLVTNYNKLTEAINKYNELRSQTKITVDVQDEEIVDVYGSGFIVETLADDGVEIYIGVPSWAARASYEHAVNLDGLLITLKNVNVPKNHILSLNLNSFYGAWVDTTSSILLLYNSDKTEAQEDAPNGWLRHREYISEDGTIKQDSDIWIDKFSKPVFTENATIEFYFYLDQINNKWYVQINDDTFELKNFDRMHIDPEELYLNFGTWGGTDMVSYFIKSITCTNFEDKVLDVMAKIDAIGTVTLESEAIINEANDAYKALPLNLKKAISNYSVLSSAIQKLQELKEGGEPAPGNSSSPSKNQPGNTDTGDSLYMLTLIAIISTLEVCVLVKSKRKLNR